MIAIQIVDFIQLLKLPAPLNILFYDFLLINNPSQIVQFIPEGIPHKFIESLGLRIFGHKKFVEGLQVGVVGRGLEGFGLVLVRGLFVFVPLLLAFVFEVLNTLENLRFSHLNTILSF